jgi:hypothetical protein
MRFFGLGLSLPRLGSCRASGPRGGLVKVVSAGPAWRLGSCFSRLIRLPRVFSRISVLNSRAFCCTLVLLKALPVPVHNVVWIIRVGAGCPADGFPAG